ncbi:MAG TPA: hypothetical protein DD789_02610, partial [Firmicutes bacterium]|nr:hypothetical protein [Bacillota bacterium]
MFMLYNLVVHVLVLCLLPLALLISLLKPNISREIMERLGLYSKEFADYLHALKQAKKDIIWLNAASVGEIIMVQPLIKELGERYPNSGYIVVTNSCSGQQMANKLFGAEKVILQPLDLPGIARRVARKVKPKLTIVVEFEMWPNIIQALSKVGSKVVLINGAMDNKILKYYRLFPGLLKATLNKLDFLGMKNETEKKIVDSLGVKPSKIRVTGDLKYDGSFKVMCKDDKKAIKDSLDIPENAIVLVAGSTHPGEEEIIFKVYIELKEEFKDLVLIIAPRQIERVAEIRQLGEGYSLKPVERTRLAAKDFKGTLGYEVVILDTIGELVDLYSISTIAFVGGSFAKIGGHNLLEPVFYGKPVLFG